MQESSTDDPEGCRGSAKVPATVLSPAARAAVTAVLADLGRPAGPIEPPLPSNGIAHGHHRIGGTGLLLRVPRWSQVGLAPLDHLRQEAAGFRHAEPSGHTPRLLATLDPGPALPLGALIVEEIAGTLPRLPEDLPRLARALAALHRVPVPPPAERRFLPCPADPVQAIWSLIRQQARFFAHAVPDPTAQAILAHNLALAEATVIDRPPAPLPPPCLVATDTHPGNFRVDITGRAWLVDLERVMVGMPALDLAHATLYTSTTWDPDCGAVLAPAAVAGCYAAWAGSVADAVAAANRPWFAPARRLVWLRTLSWMARWRVDRDPVIGPALPEPLRAHILARIDDYFSPATLNRVSADLHAFQPP